MNKFLDNVTKASSVPNVVSVETIPATGPDKITDLDGSIDKVIDLMIDKCLSDLLASEIIAELKVRAVTSSINKLKNPSPLQIKKPEIPWASIHNSLHINPQKLKDLSKTHNFHGTGPVVNSGDCVACVCTLGAKLPYNPQILRDQTGTHAMDAVGPIFGTIYQIFICMGSKLVKSTKLPRNMTEHLQQAINDYKYIVNNVQKDVFTKLNFMYDPQKLFVPMDTVRMDQGSAQMGLLDYISKESDLFVQLCPALTGAQLRGMVENHIYLIRDRASTYMFHGNVLWVLSRLKYHDYAINHSVNTHNLFIPGQDGLTPYHRKFGVPYIVPPQILTLPLFCTICRFIPKDQRKKNGGGQRFHRTMFLGYAPNGTLSKISYPRGSIIVTDEKKIYILYNQFRALPNLMYFKPVPVNERDLDEYGKPTKPLVNPNFVVDPLPVLDLTNEPLPSDADEIHVVLEEQSNLLNLNSSESSTCHDEIVTLLNTLSDLPSREEVASVSSVASEFELREEEMVASSREEIPPDPPPYEEDSPPNEHNQDLINEATTDEIYSLYSSMTTPSDEHMLLLQAKLHDKAKENDTRFIDPLDDEIFKEIPQDKMLLMLTQALEFIENNKRITPKSLEHALKGKDSKQWIKSMILEFFGVATKGTFKLEQMPEGRFSIPLKWIYKIKYDEFGEWLKDKLRLVVQGFRQREGIDYNLTYSPVIRTNLVRFVFATAAQFDLFVHKIDIENAFVYSEVEAEIYVDFPPGTDTFLREAFERFFKVKYADVRGNRWRLKLVMSLYGLKQAPRNWYNLISQFIKSKGLNGCKSEPCLFYRVEGNDIFIVAVFVDDILLIGNDNDELNSFVSSFGAVFKYTTSGKFGPKPNLYLGCEVTRGVDYITLTNKTLIRKILAKPEFKIDHIPTRTIPMDPDVDVTEDYYVKGNGNHTFPYIELVGALLYLGVSGTRHEILYAVTSLASFNSCPTEYHWDLALKVLAYLRDNIDLGITYHKTWDPKLYPGVPETYRDWLLVYVDASFGRNLATRKSTAGVIIMFAGGPIVAKKITIQINCGSSTEAEYIGMYHACIEAIILKRIIEEIFVTDRPGLHFSQMLLLEDNEFSLKIAHQYVSSRRSLHIENKYHYVRDLIRKEEVIALHLKNIHQKADGLTKPLDNILFPRFVGQLNMRIIK